MTEQRETLQAPERADVVIVGAGLAGACAALALSGDRRVIVLEADTPAAGASGAAAGIVNPFMGRKALPAWRHGEALAALDRLVREAGASPLFHRSGVLRPAGSAQQAALFAERAAEHPDEATWWAPDAARERWPHVASPFGALLVLRGGHVDLPRLVGALLDAARGRGAAVVPGRSLGGCRAGSDGVYAITGDMEIRTRLLLLAVGDGARHLPALAALPLHRVKGQTIRLARPNAVPADGPAVAGGGYVVPGLESVVAGATFEHAFTDTAPDPALDAGLRASAAALVPALAGAAVLDRRAGVRLTVPATVSPGRLPLAGPLLGHPGVWVLTGLGAKGLLTAPFLAFRLRDALDGRAPMPAETRP